MLYYAARAVLVFISYAHENTTQVKTLVDTLQSAGCIVSIDYKLRRGRLWTHQVTSEIRKADVVVTLTTEESYRSKWVERELLVADYLDKPIIPVSQEKPSNRSLVIFGLTIGTFESIASDVGCRK